MDPLKQAYRWKREGRIHVSPSEAGELLQCDPWTMNFHAHMGAFGIAYFFSGSHLRISVQGLINYLEGKIFHEENEWKNFIPPDCKQQEQYCHGVRMEAYPKIGSEEELRK